jgi:hypothetical protein
VCSSDLRGGRARTGDHRPPRRRHAGELGTAAAGKEVVEPGNPLAAVAGRRSVPPYVSVDPGPTPALLASLDLPRQPVFLLLGRRPVSESHTYSETCRKRTDFSERRQPSLPASVTPTAAAKRQRMGLSKPMVLASSHPRKQVSSCTALIRHIANPLPASRNWCRPRLPTSPGAG